MIFSGILSLALTTAYAQDGGSDDVPFECDNRYAPCGTPQQSGGGGGGGGGGSILIANTDLGDTYQYADDYDDDGIEDPFDNCPWDYNPNQADDDGDQVGTACDNCPSVGNAAQKNIDGDINGDLCDIDRDGDGVDNTIDLCADNPDPLQKDTDLDLLGDACDDDIDDDGVANLEDNCVMVSNPDQADEDPGRFGDACDDDDDGDGIRNTFDNCSHVANYDQDNLDDDSPGDECDADIDGDNIINAEDNCPLKNNPLQDDFDRDGIGEECDDRFCYVVFGDVDNCLDPTDPFTIYTPNITARTGNDVRLRLFANHRNQAMRYTFEILEAPKGSRAQIENATGAASVSTPYEYHYLEGKSVKLQPDKPGTYRIRVVSDLAWEDEVTGASNVRSEDVMTLEVEGEPTGGCASVPAPAAAWWMLLPLPLLGFRRRR